jgi:hypothetical protein
MLGPDVDTCATTDTSPAVTSAPGRPLHVPRPMRGPRSRVASSEPVDIRIVALQVGVGILRQLYGAVAEPFRYLVDGYASNRRPGSECMAFLFP